MYVLHYRGGEETRGRWSDIRIPIGPNPRYYHQALVWSHSYQCDLPLLPVWPTTTTSMTYHSYQCDLPFLPVWPTTTTSVTYHSYQCDLPPIPVWPTIATSGTYHSYQRDLPFLPVWPHLIFRISKVTLMKHRILALKILSYNIKTSNISLMKNSNIHSYFIEKLQDRGSRHCDDIQNPWTVLQMFYQQMYSPNIKQLYKIQIIL